VSFAAITLYVASQRVTPKVCAYFVIDSVLKLLDTHFVCNISQILLPRDSKKEILSSVSSHINR